MVSYRHLLVLAAILAPSWGQLPWGVPPPPGLLPYPSVSVVQPPVIVNGGGLVPQLGIGATGPLSNIQSLLTIMVQQLNQLLALKGLSASGIVLPMPTPGTSTVTLLNQIVQILHTVSASSGIMGIALPQPLPPIYNSNTNYLLGIIIQQLQQILMAQSGAPAPIQLPPSIGGVQNNQLLLTQIVQLLQKILATSGRPMLPPPPPLPLSPPPINGNTSPIVAQLLQQMLGRGGFRNFM